MKTSGGLALIGTVVAEYGAGSGTATGLAWRIIEAGNRLQIPRMFAALILLAGLGITIFYGLAALEHLVLRNGTKARYPRKNNTSHYMWDILFHIPILYSLDFTGAKWDFPPAFVEDVVMMPQVLTANRLSVGEVVYWNAAKGWVQHLHEAEVLADDKAEDVLKSAGARSVQERQVVGVYLFEVRVKDGSIVPVKTRETIRAAGPSARRDLGKQAD
jgi:hypothetical protein